MANFGAASFLPSSKEEGFLEQASVSRLSG